MLKLKKVGLFMLVITIIGSFNFHYVQGLNIGPRDHVEHQWSQEKERSSEGKIDDIKISGVDYIGSGSKEISEKSMGILHLPQRNDYQSELGYTIALIQIAINRTLGMLSFIILIYILYNGFIILTSGTESKNTEKGIKGIKTAGIAIAGIALSRLIISIMIRLIKYLTKIIN